MNRQDLLRAFEEQSIDALNFNHRKHVEVGFEILRTYDFISAAKKYADSIDMIARKAGAPDKFNMTITVAFLSLIAERMASRQFETFDDFIDAYPELLTIDVIRDKYTSGRLASSSARSVFLSFFCPISLLLDKPAA